MPGTHTARTFATNHFNQSFQALSKDVFTRADIMISALETFLLNGLYKFTYLLTYATKARLTNSTTKRLVTFTRINCFDVRRLSLFHPQACPCLSDRLPMSKNYTSKFHLYFSCYMWPWLGAPQTKTATCYAFPVSWMTPRFHIMQQIGQIRRPRVFRPDRQVALVARQTTSLGRVR